MAAQQMAEDEYTQQFELIESETRILSVLRPLLDKHTILTATLADSSRFFNTAFLKIDADKGEIVIDELHPSEGNRLFTQAGRLTLSCQLEGIDVNLTTELLQSGNENGVPFYVLKFPESIRYLQRRDAYRVPVSAAKSIAVQITDAKNTTYQGELQDISAGGLCIRFPQKKSPPAELSQQETQCTISLPDKRQISCTLIICHSNPHEPSNTIHVGGRFERLDKIQSRAIERFVVELQRMSRKEMAR